MGTHIISSDLSSPGQSGAKAYYRYVPLQSKNKRDARHRGSTVVWRAFRIAAMGIWHKR